MRSSRRLIVALGVLAMAAGLVPLRAAIAAQDPNAYTLSEQYVPSFDGTPLHIYVFRPAAAGPLGAPTVRTPVIMTFTPYDNTGGSIGGSAPFATPTNDAPPSPPDLAQAGMFERGYTYVQVADRGTGGSGGCFDLWGPDSQRDGSTMIEWAAAQPWSNEQVLTYGPSAGSFSQLAAMAMHPKHLVAAVLDRASVGSGEAWSNGVRTTTGTLWGGAWENNRVLPPSAYSPPEYLGNAVTRNLTDPGCHALQTAGPLSDPSSQYWKDRDRIVAPVLAMKTPVLFVGLFNDYNAREPVYISMFDKLAGPRWGFFGPYEHGIRTGPSGEKFSRIVMDWFDHWTKNAPLRYPPRTLVQDVDGHWRSEATWPPSDAAPRTLPLVSGSYVDTANNAEETEPPSALRFSPSPPPVATGQGIWSFTTPLPYGVHIAGNVAIAADVAAAVPVSLIALVYDIDPSGAARFVAHGAAHVARPGKVRFEIYPQDWTFGAGHRIGVLLSSADVYWFNPSNTLAQVTVAGASVTLPVLQCVRTGVAPTGVPNFVPRTPPAPFTVTAAQIAAATVHAPLPPAARSRCRARSPR